ncbi:MAG: phage holin family protein [Chthonomonas sp.]|nr:phage holin family protein [Chthonomonas sp.]
MKNILIKWLVLTISVVIAAMVLPGFEANTSDLVSLFIGSAALAFVNATLGRILKFVAAPVNCLTLGLVSLVINALMLWWVGTMNFGFKVDGFLPAFLGSLIVSLVSGVLGGVLLPDKENKD